MTDEMRAKLSRLHTRFEAVDESVKLNAYERALAKQKLRTEIETLRATLPRPVLVK